MGYTLISHRLCPYVQRVAIVLREKGIPFERIDIDLANKPEWFLRVSPMGKTPVLLVDGETVFESAVICEYIEERHAPALHPADLLRKAQHRGWIEFASAMLNDVAALYNAADADALAQRTAALRQRFGALELALGQGPYFGGADFSVVDAAFGPLFRYFDVLDSVPGLVFFDGLPRVQAWRAALAARDSVGQAVSADYGARLRAFLVARRSELSRRLGHPSTLVAT